jgi:protein-S-isoprenylcysteine O-methyltransferase Ste14
MNPRRMTDLTAAAATVVAALGVCSIAASVMTPLASSGVVAWFVAGAGLCALLAGLAALWAWQVERGHFHA